VALLRTDVSEELSALFIKVARIGELGTVLTVITALLFSSENSGWETFYQNCAERDVPCLMQFKDKVILRPTVSRPVCPSIRPPSGSRDQFYFPSHANYLKIFVISFILGCPI
jgi:hypothetical protein